MLVLSRKQNESIIIYDDIIITVVDIRGDKVRLGVEAPNEVTVHRYEIYEAIKKNNEEQFDKYLEEVKDEKIDAKKKQIYVNAYNLLSERYFTPNKSKLSALEKGLEEIGELTEERKGLINKYYSN